MIDPHELAGVEDHWLRELRSEITTLQEVHDVFSQRGWSHVDRLLKFKEEALSNAALNAPSMEVVRGHRQTVEFIRWLRNLPEETTKQLDDKTELLEAEEGTLGRTSE